jgi:two-component system, OmpR family, KDP operon response regulator KdpE
VVVAGTASRHMTDIARPRSKTGPVLIIDDEVDLLRTYERIVRHVGYDAITTELGQTGLAIARSREVALVIVDLKLPDMDGIDLVRAIRAGSDPPPVIVVTGFASSAARRAALDAGAVGYLSKPFSILALAALMRDILGGV